MRLGIPIPIPRPPAVFWLALTFAVVVIAIIILMEACSDGSKCERTIGFRTDGLYFGIKTKYDCGQKESGDELEGEVEIQPPEDTAVPPESPVTECTSVLISKDGEALTEVETVTLPDFGEFDLPKIALPETEEPIPAFVSVRCLGEGGELLASTDFAVQIEP